MDERGKVMEKLGWEKIFSGKFIFTIVTAILFYRGTMKGMFPPDQVLSIIKDVVIFYFVVNKVLTSQKINDENGAK